MAEMNEIFGIKLPGNQLPIYIVGAGGIVHDAHLPAYELAGFEVAGIFDLNAKKSNQLANQYQIHQVFDGLKAMTKTAGTDCIYDVAVPGKAVLGVLKQLPDGANVLIQKPMGEDLDEARLILEVCKEKSLNAGINFQLRYAPFINAARKLTRSGKIGQLVEIDINVNVFTPWHLWDFLFKTPRVEILYHSIHYMDLIRSFFGNPQSVFAKTTKHPNMPELASVRTTMIMDYGDLIRAQISTNHCHNFGLHNQHSYIRLEGTKGCIKIDFGVLKNYPKGEPDHAEWISTEQSEMPVWKPLKFEGTWFPHAFIGSMSEVMRAAAGEINSPDNAVADCIHTMACVEAAYMSSELGGVKPNLA